MTCQKFHGAVWAVIVCRTARPNITIAITGISITGKTG